MLVWRPSRPEALTLEDSVRPPSPQRTLWVLVAALALAATPAFADITVHAHYTLVSGDTVTRANYFSSHRTRMTAPDGREYLYDARKKRVAIIDHDLQAYWEGPVAQADSIVDSLNAMRYHEVMANVTDEKRAACGAARGVDQRLDPRHQGVAGQAHRGLSPAPS